MLEYRHLGGLDNTRLNDYKSVMTTSAHLLRHLHLQQPPDPANRAWISILVVAHGLKAVSEQLFREYGITGQQYNVLRILRGAGDGGMSCSCIAERVIDRDPDITRLLDRLERAGHIERWRNPADRRSVRARLKPSGQALVDGIDQPLAQLQTQVFTTIPPSDQKQLAALLDSMIGALYYPSPE
ncbi:MAG: MarR family transcriptional regulator [Planctomycetota bacterium]|nr:MAG: MarR family transcriptional regulator [Planctomycetota bacterium]